MIHNNYPTYEAGINVTLPIRNRAAQADNGQAIFTQRLQEMQYRQTQNTIVLNVRQTLIALVEGRAAVAAAQEARNAGAANAGRRAEKVSARLLHQLQRGAAHSRPHRRPRHALRDRINLIEAEVSFNQSMGARST